MTERVIRARFLADTRQYIADVGKAKDATKDFASDISSAAKSGDAGMQTIGKAALVGGGLMAVGLAKVTMTAADFEKEMSGVAAVSGASSDEMGRLSDAALAAGASTQLAGVTASDAARAEAELVKAGVSVSDVLGGALTGSLTLASAGQLDFADAATIAAQAMNIFDLAGSDVTHVADVLAAAANKSAADVTDMGTALRQGGLVAAQYGLSLEDTVGTLAAFADNALVGSDAGTSLKTMLQRLSPISAESAELMEELGFSAYDLQGNFIGIEGVARELQDSLAGMTQQQRDTTLAQLFGSDAVRAANILYEQGAEGIKEYVDAVDDQGAAARMAAEQNNNLKGDIEALGGALESVFIENGSKATGMLRGLTQGLTDVVGGFAAMPDPMQTVVGGLAGLTGAASLAFGGFVTLAPKFHEASDSLKKMDGSLAKFAGNNLGKISAGLAGVGAAVAIGAYAYEKATAEGRAYDATVQALTASLAPVVKGQKDLNDVLKDFLDLQQAGLSTEQVAGLNQLNVTMEEVEASILRGGDALDPLRDAVVAFGIELKGLDVGQIDSETGSAAMDNLREAMGLSREELKVLIEGMEDWDNQAQDAARSTIESAVSMGDFEASAVDAAIAANTLGDGTINYAGALHDLKPDQAEAEEGVSAMETAMADAEEAAKALEAAVKGYQDSLRAGVDPVFGMMDALRGNIEAQDAYTAALAANSDAIADNDVSLLELDSLLQAVGSSAADVEVASSELEAAFLDGKVSAEQFQGQLARWVEQGHMTQEAANVLGERMGFVADEADRVDGGRTARLYAEDHASGVIEDVKRRLGSLDGFSATAQLWVRQSSTGFGGSTGGSVPGGLTPIYRAGGGPVDHPGRPSGTDTVPVWATPGEFMVRKSVVDQVGVSALESLNRGQMGSLGGSRVDNSRHIGKIVVQTNSPRAFVDEFMWQGAGL